MLGVLRVASLLSVALSGCLGGQTGTEEIGKGGTTDHPGEASSAACDANVTPLAPGQASPLGFTADSVLPAISGTRAATLRWNEPPPELEFGPERGQSSVELGVVASSVGARFVHWTPRALGPDVGGCAPDEVQLGAQISFVTAGGAFAERFPAVLHVTQSGAARLSLSLSLSTLSGAFNVSHAPNVATKTVVLDAEITPTSTSGTLRGQLEQTSGSTASVRFFSYACWPAGDASCVGP
jgi:hypothetical protein